MIFHVTTQAEFAAAQQKGEYLPEAFAQEGFIHCAFGHQVIGVLDRYFRGRTGLVLLAIDPTKLASPVVEENLTGGTELFPHIYGPLPIAAVAGVTPLPFTESGRTH